MTDTAARPRERKEKLEDILVVDCDVHVHESPEELIPYCEMPWRVALENIKDVQEFYLDIPGFSPGTTAYEARFPSGQEGTRMVHTAEQLRQELDEIHVDIGVLFPDHFLKIPVIAQIDYASALARAPLAERADHRQRNVSLSLARPAPQPLCSTRHRRHQRNASSRRPSAGGRKQLHPDP